MVFLALTRSGLQQVLLRLLPDDSVWCACDAISQEEFSSSPPRQVTRLEYALSDAGSIQRALWVIEDHHPGESVWIESGPPSA